MIQAGTIKISSARTISVVLILNKFYQGVAVDDLSRGRSNLVPDPEAIGFEGLQILDLSTPVLHEISKIVDEIDAACVRRREASSGFALANCAFRRVERQAHRALHRPLRLGVSLAGRISEMHEPIQIGAD